MTHRFVKLIYIIAIAVILAYTYSCREKNIFCYVATNPLFHNAQEFFETLCGKQEIRNSATVPYDSLYPLRHNCPAEYEADYQLGAFELSCLSKYQGDYSYKRFDSSLFWKYQWWLDSARSKLSDNILRMNDSSFMVLPRYYNNPFFRTFGTSGTSIISASTYQMFNEGILFAQTQIGQVNLKNITHFEEYKEYPDILLSSLFYQAYNKNGREDKDRYEGISVESMGNSLHAYALFVRVFNIKIEDQHYPIVYATVFPMKRWGYVWLLDAKTFSAEFQIDYAQIGFNQQRTELQVNHVSPSAKSENRNHVFVGTGSQINDVALLGARCIIRLEDGTKDTIQIQR